MAIRYQCLNCKYLSTNNTCSIFRYLMFDGSSCEQYSGKSSAYTQPKSAYTPPSKTRKIRKSLIITSVLILCSVLLYIFTQKPPTIEHLVEKLMKTDDTEKRKEIACSLADSLQPRAIQLLLGFQEPIQSPVQSIRAATALKEMFIRYQNIVNQQNNIARAYECISFIPSNEAVRYLGVQSVGNQEPKSALNLVKTMPYEEKETALLSGLLAPNGNEAMVDAVIAELKLTYGLNAQSKIFDLWLQHYEIKNFKRALDSYGNLSQFDDNAMIKVIDKWSQNKDSNQLLSVISAFGDRAVSYLINRIEDTNYQDLLARLGESSLAELQTLMNSSDEQTWTAAANTIVQMGKYHPETTDFLYRAVDDSNLRIVAENYRFYIRAGIEGSEDVLIRALDRYFSRPMCKDYINCRYDYLENLARDIANRHGYQVYSTHGTHSGPRWGEGN